MYRIKVPTEKDIYELSELGKMFLPASDLSMTCGGSSAECDLELSGTDKNAMKRRLYAFLSERTGKEQDWGILIGVRPGKLYSELCRSLGSEKAEESLRRDYLVSEEKIALLREVRRTQLETPMDGSPEAAGVYVGIPFCPTRCLYCSFTSNRFTKEASVKYMRALLREIDAVKSIMDRKGMYAESIYIGGGTPTSLDCEEFELLLSSVRDAFFSERTKEWTVEAGRPDTITAEKLALIERYGAGRISINPQTMKQSTLDAIGRSHTVAQTEEAFALAKSSYKGKINADLIAGLPGEDPDDFEASLARIIELSPQDITVHTLAVKRASRLIDEDAGLALRQAGNVREMLGRGQKMLARAGYRPYYLYRQKHMAGNFENVGYCQEGGASVYNIRIMEEDLSILALGAGGISKVYFGAENRIERVPNVSNYEIYIDRVGEMIERKEKGFL